MELFSTARFKKYNEQILNVPGTGKRLPRCVNFIIFMTLCSIGFSQETFLNPVNPGNPISTSNDYANNPAFANYKLHTGVDLFAPTGSNGNVTAAASGFVVFVQDMFGTGISDGCSGAGDHGMGTNVMIRHSMADGSHAETSYSHLSTRYVDQGDFVYRGEVIGKTGGSGYGSSTYWTDHLHFEIRTDHFACNRPGSKISTDPTTRWGYVPTNSHPDTYGYESPYQYWGGYGTGASAFVTTTPVPSNPTQNQSVDFAGSVDFNLGSVPNATHHRIQVIRINGASPVWDPQNGFSSGTNCQGGELVVNHPTGAVSGFIWDAASVSNSGVCAAPLAGAHYAYTVRTYNPVNHESTYSFPIFFYLNPDACASGGGDCINLSVDNASSTSNVMPGGIVNYSFDNSLLGNASGATSFDTELYVSNSQSSYTATDFKASYSATLDPQNLIVCQTGTLTAPTSDGTYYVHIVTDPNDDVPEYENGDNDKVFALTVSNSGGGSVTCLPAENVSTTNLSPTNIDITFDNSPTGNSYTVFVRELGSVSWSVLTPINQNPGWVATYSANPGLTYEYFVKALCTDGTTADSPIQTVTTPVNACSLTGLSAYDISHNFARASWDVLSAGITYQVNLYDASGSQITEKYISNTSTFFSNLTPDSDYIVTVRGLCPTGAQMVSASVSFTTNDFPCGPITGLTADTDAYETTFSWTDPSGNVGQSYWTWSTSGGTTSGQNNGFTNSVTIPVTGPQDITFQVYGNCGSGVITPTESITISIPQVTCANIQGLNLVTSTSTSLSFNWSAEDDATHYEYRLLDAAGTIIAYDDYLDGTFAIISNLTPQATYTFEVAANCAGQTSGFETLTATTTVGTGTSPAVEFSKVITEGGSTFFGDVAIIGNSIVGLANNRFVTFSKEGVLEGGFQLTVNNALLFFEKVIHLSDGNLVAVGDYTPPGASKKNPCLVKFSFSGTVIWARELSGISGEHDYGENIVEDSSGNILICGGTYSYGTLGGMDAYLIKLSATGNLLWQRGYGALGHQWSFALALAPDGGYYVAGRSQNPDSNISTKNGMFVFKISDNGSPIWRKMFLNTTVHSEVKDIRVADDGSLFFVGEYDYEAIFGKISSNGSLAFAKAVIGSGNWNKLNEITISNIGDIYLCGEFKDNSGEQQFGMLQFSSSGTLLEAKLFASNEENYGRAIESDGTHIYAGGFTEGFPDDGANKGLLLKRPLDLQSSCYTLSFNPTITDVALQSQNYTPVSNPSFGIHNITVSSAPLNFNEVDLCGAPPCPVANASVDQNTNCPDEPFVFTYIGSPGGTVTWVSSDGSSVSGTSASFSFGQPGTYTVTCTVSDQDCIDAFALDVTVENEPSATVVVTDPACPGSTGLVEVQTATSNSILWSDGNTQLLRDDLSAGSYDLTVTNVLGCSEEYSVTLQDGGTYPVAGFSYQASTVNRTFDFTSTATNASLIQWDFGDGQIATGTGVSHTYGSQGTFTVIQSATNACGTVTTSQNITISCPQPIIQTSSDLSLCIGETVNLTALGVSSATVEWHIIETGELDSGTTLTTSFSSAGSYTVVLRATIGNCTVSTVSFLTVQDGPGVSTMHTDPSCDNIADGSIQITSATGTGFVWSDGSTVANRNNLISGSYAITVSDNEGCSTTTSVTLLPSQDAPISGFTYSIGNAGAVSFQNTSSNSDSYSWDFSDGGASTAGSPNHTFSTDGDYLVSLTASNSCGTDVFSQTVTVTGTNTGSSQPFGPVTPTNLFGVFLGQAMVDSIPAEASDWVAAFDESGNLAGASQIIIASGVAYISLTIFGDDPGTAQDEGIGPGENFTIQLFDSSEGVYLNYPTSQPVEFDAWLNTNGAPMPAYSDFTQIYNWQTSCVDQISFGVGWTLFSLDVVPFDSTVTTVFQDFIIQGVLESISTLKASGSIFFQPNLPFATLDHIEKGQSYWIKLNAPMTLSVEGVCIEESYRKPLINGWQMVAYIPGIDQMVDVYFANEIASGNLEVVTGFINGQGGIFYDPNLPPFLSPPFPMQNGQGYFVKYNDSNLTGGGSTSSKYATYTADISAFSTAVSYSIRTADGEIVGTGKKRQRDGFLSPITIYANDRETDSNGIEPGTKLYLYADDQRISSEIKFNEQRDVVIIPLTSNDKQNSSIQVRPNPVTDMIYAQIDPSINATQYRVYNAIGQLLHQGKVLERELTLSVAMLPSGAYRLVLMNDHLRPTATSTFVVAH